MDRRAYEFNSPVSVVALERGEAHPEDGIPATNALLEAASRSLIVEVLKQAESRDALVLRSFDTHGCHAAVPLSFSSDLTAVAETNLLEKEPQRIELESRCAFTARYTPYEIKTHRLNLVRLGVRS